MSSTYNSTAAGYYNAYGNAARKDEHDYAIHLGDYIYEGGGGGERAHSPAHEIFTLHDYRTRHNQYRSDPDLQLLTQNAPLISTWDDHGKVLRSPRLEGS
ncbi:alkaline phosphatase D family protein [Candidatus Bathyarchaeota archaeon]|nr:alkaline phosphatase D family protein [Candidatus Bathyarchaeota archaeon]